MKKILLSGTVMLFSLAAFSQNDTTHKSSNGDTVFVGNFIIIKNHKEGDTNYDSVPPKKDNYVIINIPRRRSYSPKPSNKTISTNYFIFDLGFANYDDRTDYSSTAVQAFAPGFTKDDLKLKTVKSSNVDFWLFMQRLNMVKHVINLKYGLGLEMFNFRYKNDVTFTTHPEGLKLDTINFSKDKLFASYATVPVMINIKPSPNHRHSFSLSAGVSAGYRIGTHSKQVSGERGKVKDHDDFNLDNWRFAYIAELGLGPVHLYGSYSIKSMFEDALKQYPYTIGIRFSNW